MFSRSLITVSAVLALVACGANPTKTAAAQQGKRIDGVKLSAGVIGIAKQEGKVELLKDERVNCEKYTPLGSHHTKYRCLTVAEKQADEEANQAEMRKLVVPPPSVGSSPIGN